MSEAPMNITPLNTTSKRPRPAALGAVNESEATDGRNDSPNHGRSDDATERLEETLTEEDQALITEGYGLRCAQSFYENQQKLLSQVTETTDPSLEAIKLPHSKVGKDLISKLQEALRALQSFKNEADGVFDVATDDSADAFSAENLGDKDLAQHLDEKQGKMLLCESTDGVLKDALRQLAQHELPHKKVSFKLVQQELAHKRELAQQELAHKRELAQQALKLAQKELELEAAAISKAVTEVNHILSTTSSLSQGEKSHFPTKELDEKISKRKKTQKEIALVTPKRDAEQLPAQGNSKLQELLQHPQDFPKDHFFHEKSVAQVQLPDEVKLAAKAYNNVFRGCKCFLESPDASRAKSEQPTDASKVASKKPANLSAYKDDVETGLKALCDEYQRLKNEDVSANTDENYCLPGCRAQEKDGAQPIFHWILRMFAGCMKPNDGDSTESSDNEKRSSPRRTQAARESKMVGLGRADDPVSIRIGDFTLTKIGNYLYVFPPDAAPLVIEIKTFRTRSLSPVELNSRCINQSINHQGAALRVSFNFAGCGLDGFGTGVLASLHYVQITRLQLVHMGTSNATVQFLKTKKFPLLSKDNFKKWAQSNSRSDEEQVEIGKIEHELYESVKESDEESEEYLMGFKALYQCFTSSSDDLFGTSWRKYSNLENIIGRGTFSDVFKVGSNVLKVSRCGRLTRFETEASALRHLGDHVGLPELKDVGMLALNIEGVSFKLPALLLSPLGMPLYRHHSFTRKDSTFINKVGDDVSSALAYCHEKGICQNDVHSKNVIWVNDNAMLIDFSHAKHIGSKVEGILGTLDTAHRQAQSGEPWTPQPFHDKAALAFTLSILCNGGTPKWASLTEPLKGDKGKADARFGQAMSSIQELFGEKCTFLELLECDQHSAQSGCY